MGTAHSASGRPHKRTLCQFSLVKDTQLPWFLARVHKQGRLILHTHLYQKIVLETTSNKVCENALSITRHYIATQDGDNLPLQDSDPSARLVDYPFLVMD